MATDLCSLIKLLEVSRNQPQSGYALAGVSKGEQSDLAQHQYLVAMIAWQLADHVIRGGGTVNVERVLKLSLVHDLGELLGGDIAAPYARANPLARKAAKAFEAENQAFIARSFGKTGEQIQVLFEEVRTATSDEAQVVKIADFIEMTHYKQLVGRLTEGDVSLAKNVCDKRLSLIHDPKIRSVLRSLVDDWLVSIGSPTGELFEPVKRVNHE